MSNITVINFNKCKCTQNILEYKWNLCVCVYRQVKIKAQNTTTNKAILTN